jgi:hypothetical protein
MYYENPKTITDYIGIVFAVCPATHNLTHNQVRSTEMSDYNYIFLHWSCSFIIMLNLRMYYRIHCF